MMREWFIILNIWAMPAWGRPSGMPRQPPFSLKLSEQVDEPCRPISFSPAARLSMFRSKSA
jgi:hypothetical protein